MAARSFIVWISSLLFLLSQPVLFVQAKSSTRDGVYKAVQAKQGSAIYDKQCAMCHGATLQGMGQNPPLVGDDFLKNWDDQTLADLDSKIRATMPATNPGSLTPEDTVQLLAYILSANNFPAGKADLSANSDSLKTIHIDQPPAKP